MNKIDEQIMYFRYLQVGREDGPAGELMASYW